MGNKKIIKRPSLKKTIGKKLEEKVYRQSVDLNVKKWQLKQGVVREQLGAVRETRAQEQIYLQSKALESSLDGIFIIDAVKPDFPIIYANPSFYTVIQEVRSLVKVIFCIINLIAI
ncbi:MAG: hypothetical protein HQL12_06710 [Candidatus Omnitrophica bacterium]|nr:hypothetical protein [Candidatus Omnitrophota bacterium]